MKKKPCLCLIIGLPGSGKSTLGHQLKEFLDLRRDRRNENLTVLRETDEYFVDATTKEYKFDPSKLAEYHAECQKSTECDLSNGVNVIVTNTNLTKWERKHYFGIARRTKCIVRIIIMRNNYGNVHGVPQEKIDQMKERFQEVSSDEFEGIDDIRFIDACALRKSIFNEMNFLKLMESASNLWKGND